MGGGEGEAEAIAEQSVVRNCIVRCAMLEPTNECEDVGSDAIAVSVAALTPLPAPTAKMVMPADLSVCAVAMAAALPPYALFCCPSVKRKTIGR